MRGKLVMDSGISAPWIMETWAVIVFAGVEDLCVAVSRR